MLDQPAITFEALSPALGARVHGLDLAGPDSPERAKMLVDADSVGTVSSKPMLS